MSDRQEFIKSIKGYQAWMLKEFAINPVFRMFLRERMGVSSKTFENQILLCSDRDYGLHQDFQKIKSIYEIFNNLSKEYKTRCSIRNGMDDVPIPFLYWRVPISDFTPIYSIKVNEALSEEFLEEINTLIVLNE